MNEGEQSVGGMRNSLFRRKNIAWKEGKKRVEEEWDGGREGVWQMFIP